MARQTHSIRAPFVLESGAVLPRLDIAYHTYGTLAPDASNVVWVCHALTGSSDAADWWSGLIGAGTLFDPKHYFIVCANMLGSCYGTTGAASLHPVTRKPYGPAFPTVTIRDMVRAHDALRQHLGIERIACAIGGSMGGQQVLEWAIEQPALFENLVLIATNAQHSAWGIALNTAQRLALESDPTFYGLSPKAGVRGLAAARAIGMVSYRTYEAFCHAQTGYIPDSDIHKADSYIRYQGHKLVQRFNPHSYYALTKAMDSHDIGRARDKAERVLAGIQARTLVLGIETDILFPPSEQRFLAQHIPNAQYGSITSQYGHDGFLVEHRQLAARVAEFLHNSKQAKTFYSHSLSQEGVLL